MWHLQAQLHGRVGPSVPQLDAAQRSRSSTLLQRGGSASPSPSPPFSSLAAANGQPPVLVDPSLFPFADPLRFGRDVALPSSLAVVGADGCVFVYVDLGSASVPFEGGVLCAMPSLRRTPLQFNAGNQPPDDCSGGLAIDFQAWARSGSDPMLQAGVQVGGQFWHRDAAHMDGTGIGLSDAGSHVMLP